ncbi:MAG: glycosyltransferase family 4 protein [Actinomycetia bacterium]|nr:glycosyltransferase family 4 protein [Actinomycetes bacterium]MCH9761059.1 glycosyltransferase family 4 protein [Actinomycetes bacterium]
MSVALVSAVDPYPTDSGKKIVLAGFLDYFAERYGPDEVHYIKVGAAPKHQFPVPLRVVPGPSRVEVLANIATKVMTGRATLQEAFLGSRRTAAEITRVMSEIRPRLQVFDTIRMAQYAPTHVAAQQICYLDDLFSDRYDRMLQAVKRFPDVDSSPLGAFAEHVPRQLQPLGANRWSQSALLRLERTLVRRSEDRAARAFRRCLLLNAEETALLSRRAGVAPGRITCVPPLLAAPSPPKRLNQGTPTFVFLGLLSLPHNDDGLRWFLRSIWPTMLIRCPEARLRVIGRDVGAEVLALTAEMSDSVTVDGYVPDLGEALGRATAVLNPLRFGSGIKIKVIEALGRGVPVVSTTVGAEGIASGPGTGILVGDGPGEITDLLCALTDEACNARTSSEARAHFLEKYSRQAVFDAYDAAFAVPQGAVH